MLQKGRFTLIYKLMTLIDEEKCSKKMINTIKEEFYGQRETLEVRVTR